MLPAPQSCWRPWRERFLARSTRPLPATTAPRLDPERRRLLAASLAVFQLGESGEGRIAHQIRHARISGIDDDYRAALRLFVAEEGRHGRILGQMVRALGGELLGHTWTEALFRRGRRLLGVRLKLLVLLAAEVVAVVFYGALVAGLPASPMRQALAEVVADEQLHLDFHVAFFQTQTGSRARRLGFSWVWWTVALSACAAVAWDHRRLLRALGTPLRSVVAASLQQIARVDDRVRQRKPKRRRSPRLTARLTATFGPPRMQAR